MSGDCTEKPRAPKKAKWLKYQGLEDLGKLLNAMHKKGVTPEKLYVLNDKESISLKFKETDKWKAVSLVAHVGNIVVIEDKRAYAILEEDFNKLWEAV